MDADACSCPERFQLGGRLIHPLRFSETKELFLVKRLLVFEHEIDGTPELVGKDRESLGFTMFTGEPFEIPFAWLVAFEEKHRCLGEGPLEMSVTDLFTTGSVFFAVGFFDAFYQTAVGDEILDLGETLDGFDLIEDDQSQDSAYSRNGLKQGIGTKIVLFGRSYDIMFQLGQEAIIGFDHLQVGGHALLDGRVIESLNDSFSVLGFGNASQGIREVVLASGILDMSKELGPFSHEVIPSSEKISGGAHPGRIDISLREHAAPEQGGDLMGVDLIVFGFSSVNGFHIEGMA